MFYHEEKLEKSVFYVGTDSTYYHHPCILFLLSDVYGAKSDSQNAVFTPNHYAGYRWSCHSLYCIAYPEHNRI